MPTIRELPAVDAAADTTTAYALPYFIDRFEGVLSDPQRRGPPRHRADRRGDRDPHPGRARR